jgi:hypothetical protein
MLSPSCYWGTGFFGDPKQEPSLKIEMKGTMILTTFLFTIARNLAAIKLLARESPMVIEHPERSTTEGEETITVVEWLGASCHFSYHSGFINSCPSMSKALNSI